MRDNSSVVRERSENRSESIAAAVAKEEGGLNFISEVLVHVKDEGGWDDASLGDKEGGVDGSRHKRHSSAVGIDRLNFSPLTVPAVPPRSPSPYLPDPRLGSECSDSPPNQDQSTVIKTRSANVSPHTHQSSGSAILASRNIPTPPRQNFPTHKRSFSDMPSSRGLDFSASAGSKGNKTVTPSHLEKKPLSPSLPSSHISAASSNSTAVSVARHPHVIDLTAKMRQVCPQYKKDISSSSQQ